MAISVWRDVARIRCGLGLGAALVGFSVAGTLPAGAAPVAQAPLCFGQPATIVAETKDEWQAINGTEGQDVIVVYGGIVWLSTGVAATISSAVAGWRCMVATVTTALRSRA